MRLIHGDCLEVLPTLDAESVDAVITDPPYSSGGAFRGDRMAPAKDKYPNRRLDVSGAPQLYSDFSGDNRDQRSYLLWCSLWLGECLRVTKPGGVCCLFTDWRQLPTTTDALQAGGWVWRGIVAWDKTEGGRPSMGRFKAQCEFIVWGSRGAMQERKEVGCLAGVFRHVPNHQKYHLAGKPEGLMRDLVAICPPGGKVLDPFAGSGTTLLACQQTGLSAIGIEKDAACVELARVRLAKAAPLFTEAV